MSAFSYIKAKLLQLGRLKAIDTYVESESIIVYEPDRIISEIPDNGLITKQNAQDLISGGTSDLYVPYTGATADVDLGTKKITANSLNTSGAGGHTLSLVGSTILSADSHIDITPLAGTYVQILGAALRASQAPVDPNDVVRLQDVVVISGSVLDTSYFI